MFLRCLLRILFVCIAYIKPASNGDKEITQFTLRNCLRCACRILYLKDLFLPCCELSDTRWNIPKLRKLLEKILTKNIEFYNFEVKHGFPHIGKRKMLLNARRMSRGVEGMEAILLAIEDITIHKDTGE